ncbi:unnamed protein product [Brachionus calyciflorus]|uniref:DUF4371 domain-containing protein n=1 Tax=Brachionus calyciflorus TaxID=104777 RepID=A0A814QMG3_9BILA|nr:unnamed protein product [Brachionus calyciflorus]
MSGVYKGLASRIKKEALYALYVHCYAHRLNHALQDSCNNIKEVRNLLGQINSIYILFEGSSKRNFIFETMKIDTNESKLRLKLLSDTRWSSRSAILKSVLDNYETILKTF